MARELTDGFMLAAQVNKEILARIFAFGFLKRIPRVHRSISEGRDLDIWFDRPLFELVRNADPAANIAEIELRMTARLSDKLDEARVFLKARGTLILKTVLAGANTFVSPSLDLSRSRDGDFSLTMSTDSEFDDVVLRVMRDTLRTESPFTVSPLIPEGPQTQLRTYFNLGSGIDLMALFVDLPGGSPPPTPPTVERRTTQERPVTLLVPEDLVHAQLQSSLEEVGFASLPQPVPGRPDVVLRSLAIDLANGPLIVSGAGTRTTDVVGIDLKTDFNFKAFLQLLIEDDKIATHVIRTQQDVDDVLGDIVNFAGGGFITRLLEEIVPEAIGSIFGTTFRRASFFAKDVPGDEAFVGAQNLGNIRTFANGLGVPVETTVPVLKPAEPPYMRGHKESREFHVSSGCQFGDLISPRNLRKFTRHEQALRDGYDGCATCQPKFNIASFGDLGFTVKQPAGAPTGPVTITATYQGKAVRFGVPVAPPPETGVANRPFVDTDGVPTHRHGFSKIVPGIWAVALACGTWSVTGTLVVGTRFIDANGELQGTRTEVSAVVGQPDIQVASDT